VAVQKGHEELEVFFLAVVGGRRKKQKVASQGREQLPQVVALRVLDLTAKVGGGHLVRLVADDQIPAPLWGGKLGLDVFVAAQLVEPGDDQIVLEEPVSRPRGFQLVVGQDVEGQMEPSKELVLPLLSKTSGTDHKAALQVPSRDELADEKARHDGLSGA